MNVACDYEAPMQMLTTEKYIAAGTHMHNGNGRSVVIGRSSTEVQKLGDGGIEKSHPCKLG